MFVYDEIVVKYLWLMAFVLDVQLLLPTDYRLQLSAYDVECSAGNMFV